LYLPFSSVETGNSLIFEKELLFKVVFPSANSALAPFFKTQTIIAS
jgi:hypothetical protein